jgi:HSP20 family molecular chaperone IbpA
MHRATIELMHEQVRTIYRALTGAELNEKESEATAEGAEAPPADSEIERRFAELEGLVRQNPVLGERVPPFSFTPLADIIDTGQDLLVEIAAPGVEVGDVEVQVTDHALSVSGVRRGERASTDRAYVHAEIPRGPFRRALPLPCSVEPQPDVQVQAGLLRIRLHKL